MAASFSRSCKFRASVLFPALEAPLSRMTRPLRGRGAFRFSAGSFSPMVSWFSGRFAEVFRSPFPGRQVPAPSVRVGASWRERQAGFQRMSDAAVMEGSWAS